MDDNPYRSPAESGQLNREPEDWPAKLRRLAIGPRFASAWVIIIVGIMVLVAMVAWAASRLS